jgi:two-component system cell cycle sensor histidine kinase/response regulator CckA
VQRDSCNSIGSQPLQILLVGTREEDFFIIHDLLRAGETQIVANLDQASDLEEVRAKFARRSYDLVLFEYESSEDEAVRIVRELHLQNKSVPCLFLTEQADEATLAEIIRAGACDCASRSELNQASLARAIRSAVSQHHIEKQRRDAEDTLRRLYSAIEQSADMVVITDGSGAIEYVNPAFEEATGYSRAEVMGKTPRILKSGEQSPKIYRELWETILAGKVFRGVVVNRKKSGESYIAEKTITPVRNTEGQVTHFISNDKDITEQRRLEGVLYQAQKMDAIGQLAGGVAHDFNNLLMVISSYAELMRDSIGPEHPLHRNVQEILKASRRAADLTRQLLAFGRKQTQSLQMLDLDGILTDISKMLPRLIGEDIDLIIAPGADLGRVRLDPIQVEQVVLNLAANARDAMPAGGRLTLETRNVTLDGNYAPERTMVPAGDYVLLEVTDTGEGIAAEHLPHIFEPFYTTKEQGKGTGLGLATVYGIVKQSGGFIWVYSERGMGTTFKVYFPRVHQGTSRTQDPRKPLAEADLRGCETLLFVEDENAVRHPAVEFLKKLGYIVIEAQDGLQAVDVASKFTGRIDLMITDVVMPGMSGGQLAGILGAKYPDMKVVFVSGYAERVVLKHKIVDVHTNFLQKPFTLQCLAGKIRETLAHRAAKAAGSH